MRPLIVQVPKGSGRAVLEKAKKFDGKNLSLLNGTDTERELDVIIAFISNKQVGKFIADLNQLPEPQITLFPQGVMPLYPPAAQAPDQVTDVAPRSPIEIFLSGLQSKGSWKGFMGYAALASVVVWIGLYTNTSYLLVAAMLIAPFAGPAMNTALATATGDWVLLRQGLLRYVISLVITIVGTMVLSFVLQQEVATAMMVDTSQISSVAILLPLAAGAAGALNLVQSERDSLVSGAAVGMLVAASLAPPAGIVGMSIAVGEWAMAKSGLFLLVLQLVGINLSGSLVFRLYGLSVERVRFQRGNKNIFATSIVVTTICLAAIIFWQFGLTPNLQRSSLSQRAEADIQQIMKENNTAALVEANVNFTRANIPGQNSLLCVIYVQKKQANVSSETIKTQLTRAIQEGLRQRDYTNITPLVNVIVMEPPT